MKCMLNWTLLCDQCQHNQRINNNNNTVSPVDKNRRRKRRKERERERQGWGRRKTLEDKNEGKKVCGIEQILIAQWLLARLTDERDRWRRKKKLHNEIPGGSMMATVKCMAFSILCNEHVLLLYRTSLYILFYRVIVANTSKHSVLCHLNALTSAVNDFTLNESIDLTISVYLCAKEPYVCMCDVCNATRISIIWLSVATIFVLVQLYS